MNLTINKNSIYMALLSVAIFDSSISAMLFNKDALASIHQICLYLFLFLSLACILISKHSKKLLFINLVVYGFAVMSYSISGNTDFMITLLLIMLNQYTTIGIDRVLKRIYRIKLPILLAGILLSIIGVLDIGTMVQFGGEKGAILGFGNANGFSGHCGIVMLLWIAIHRNDRHLYRCIPVMALLEGVVFYLTKSRTGLFVMILMIVIIVLREFESYVNHFLKISKWIMPILIVGNFLLIFFQYFGMFSTVVGDVLGKFFNGRLLLAAMNLRTYPVTLFGQNMDRSIITAKYAYTALDNGYTYVLICYGIVGLLIQCVLMQIAMLQLKKHNEYILCAITFLLAFWMVYEGMMIGATTNFSMLFATAYVMLNMKQQENKQREIVI